MLDRQNVGQNVALELIGFARQQVHQLGMDEESVLSGNAFIQHADFDRSIGAFLEIDRRRSIDPTGGFRILHDGGLIEPETQVDRNAGIAYKFTVSTTLTIRNLDESVKQKLRVQAATRALDGSGGEGHPDPGRHGCPSSR